MVEQLRRLRRYRFAVEYGGRVVVQEIDVPFTPEEIAALGSLRTIMDGWPMISQDSSLISVLYSEVVVIPWGGMLLDRESALDHMHRTIRNIRWVRENCGRLNGYALVAKDLSEIEQGLLRFVPEMQEEKEE